MLSVKVRAQGVDVGPFLHDGDGLVANGRLPVDSRRGVDGRSVLDAAGLLEHQRHHLFEFFEESLSPAFGGFNLS